MVTHDAKAASIAKRVLFLGDGLIVQELRDPTPSTVLEALSSLRLA
jgi:putative ABC transport system ATP-binding protein